jgi:hypothetical protein
LRRGKGKFNVRELVARLVEQVPVGIGGVSRCGSHETSGARGRRKHES